MGNLKQCAKNTEKERLGNIIMCTLHTIYYMYSV